MKKRKNGEEKVINIEKIKLLVDINPSFSEIMVGKIGKIEIISKIIAHNIHIIESSIFKPFFLIFKIMNIKVKILETIKTTFNPKKIIPFYYLIFF